MRRFLGDLGSLATRNVRRNPGRTASIAFLIALIIGYTVSVNGSLASEQDYTRRQIYFSVGCSDISITLTSSANVSESIAKVENISGVSSTTMEYVFYGDSSAGSLTLKAINPNAWPEIGYYEDEWFIGENAKDAFRAMAEDNRTIVLDRRFAKYLDLEVGDTIALTFGGDKAIYNLRIIGFFGSEDTQQSPYYPRPIGPMDETFVVYPSSYCWSFVSEEFYKEVKGKVYAYPKMLVTLKPEADRSGVVEEIRNFDPSICWVSFVDETLEAQQGRAELTGIINIQRLGITFAVLAASIGTGLVTIVGLSERRKEISLVNVRGASYKQLIITLLSESLAVVAFALILGSIVGLIILRGNIMSANVYLYSLVKRRIVLSRDFLAMWASSYLLIVVSLIIPVLLVSRRYVSKLGDAVRQR